MQENWSRGPSLGGLIILLIVLLLIASAVNESRYNHIAELTAQKVAAMQEDDYNHGQ